MYWREWRDQAKDRGISPEHGLGCSRLISFSISPYHLLELFLSGICRYAEAKRFDIRTYTREKKCEEKGWGNNKNTTVLQGMNTLWYLPPSSNSLIISLSVPVMGIIIFMKSWGWVLCANKWKCESNSQRAYLNKFVIWNAKETLHLA